MHDAQWSHMHAARISSRMCWAHPVGNLALWCLVQPRPSARGLHASSIWMRHGVAWLGCRWEEMQACPAVKRYASVLQERDKGAVFGNATLYCPRRFTLCWEEHRSRALITAFSFYDAQNVQQVKRPLPPPLRPTPGPGRQLPTALRALRDPCMAGDAACTLAREAPQVHDAACMHACVTAPSVAACRYCTCATCTWRGRRTGRRTASARRAARCRACRRTWLRTGCTPRTRMCWWWATSTAGRRRAWPRCCAGGRWRGKGGGRGVHACVGIHGMDVCVGVGGEYQLASEAIESEGLPHTIKHGSSHAAAPAAAAAGRGRLEGGTTEPHLPNVVVTQVRMHAWPDAFAMQCSSPAPAFRACMRVMRASMHGLRACLPGMPAYGLHACIWPAGVHQPSVRAARSVQRCQAAAALHTQGVHGRARGCGWWGGGRGGRRGGRRGGHAGDVVPCASEVSCVA